MLVWLLFGVCIVPAGCATRGAASGAAEEFGQELMRVIEHALVYREKHNEWPREPADLRETMLAHDADPAVLRGVRFLRLRDDLLIQKYVPDGGHMVLVLDRTSTREDVTIRSPTFEEEMRLRMADPARR